MTPDEVAALQAHYGQGAQPSLAKDIDGIIEVGHVHYGKAAFDEASQNVADVLGEKSGPVMDMLRAFDKPHDVIAHLGDNPARLKAFAALTPERQRVELARIEAQLGGPVRMGADPAWKAPEMKTSRVADEDWKTSFGANLSDAQWNKEFDRRQAARGRR